MSSLISGILGSSGLNLPKTVKIEGISVDISSLEEKLLSGGSVSLSDLIPLLLSFLAARATSPVSSLEPPTQQEDPVEEIPSPPELGKPKLAKLVIAMLDVSNRDNSFGWRKRYGTPAPNLLTWNQRVRFESSAFDENGNKVDLEDLDHVLPMIWNWVWDNQSGSYYQDESGKEFFQAGGRVACGGTFYNKNHGGTLAIKLVAGDANRHKVKFSLRSGDVVSNEVEFVVA